MKNSRQEAVLTAVLVAAGLLPLSAKADIFFSKYGEELIYTLHTHLTSPTWRLPSSDEIKLAAVCFINDTAACSDGMFGYGEDVSGGGSGFGGVPDYDLYDAERCRKEGYGLTSCAAGETPEGFCIYNSAYFARCVCPASYKTCELPYYGVGTACGDKYASCEKDTERACKELDSEFTDTCQTGWKVDPNNACEYDPTYGKCCNLCEGYDYTTIPEGYIADGAACVDCNGTSKYKIKINPCDGFQDCGVMGGDTGAKTCMSGSQIKYDNCKPCPNLGTLSSCPSPFTCTYEECSNRYYKSGCQSSYDWNASAQTCTPQCASSYQYTCTGTNETSGSGTSCGGLYEACNCSSGYFWSGESCVEENACMKGSQLGYILNSDMTVTSSKQSGKTPIGVVVCSYENGGGQAISLSYEQESSWGFGDDFIQQWDLEDALADVASCVNTQSMITAYGMTGGQDISGNYSTEGTVAGDWCVPALGVFAAYAENMDFINNIIESVGGNPLKNGYYWSSSRMHINNGWCYYVGANNYNCGGNVQFKHLVRPVIGFCKAGYEYDKSTDSCKACSSSYKYTCTGSGESPSGDSCGGKYVSCYCSYGYNWSGSKCSENSCCGYSRSYTCQSNAIDYNDTCQSGSSTLYKCSACVYTMTDYGECLDFGETPSPWGCS